MRVVDAAEHYATEAGIDWDALVDLTRAAMASGFACIAERARDGEIDPRAPLYDALGDFPAEFLRIRSSLVEALPVAASPVSEGERTDG